MDFTISPEHMALIDHCHQFAVKEIQPFITQIEEDLEFRKSLFIRMAKMGYFHLSVSEAHAKNRSHDTLSYALAVKAIAKVDAGVAVAMSVTNMVAETIHRFGTATQKKKYLTAIAHGECVPASFALTEKNAGSDPSSLQTRVFVDSKDSDYVVLDGEKQFITNGDLSGVIIVMAKGEKGISAYLVDRGTPGLVVTKKERKLGLLTVNLVSLRLDKCRIKKSQLLGKEGAGLKLALSALDSGRIGIAAQALGIAEAAYEAAVQFSQQRQQFGHAICDNQVIAFRIADMRVKLETGHLLLYKAAWKKDQGQQYTIEASMAKLYCSEIANEIASDALQIHGGYGYVKDYPMEKYFRDARVTTLYEGTSEIQRLVISRSILSHR